MSKDCHCETASSGSYLLGIVAGWDEAAAALLTKSGEAFLKDDDKRAEVLRGLSKDFQEAAKNRRKQYDQHNVDFPITEDAHDHGT